MNRRNVFLLAQTVRVEGDQAAVAAEIDMARPCQAGSEIKFIAWKPVPLIEYKYLFPFEVGFREAEAGGDPKVIVQIEDDLARVIRRQTGARGEDLDDSLREEGKR